MDYPRFWTINQLMAMNGLGKGCIENEGATHPLQRHP
jgi:hypothetical protein